VLKALIGNGGLETVRMAIYAMQFRRKKLDAKTNRYSSLNHKVGVGSKTLFQHDILEKYAHVNQAIPLYAFYNHLDPCNYPTKWNCPLPFDLTKLGCTVTSLQNVKYAIKNRGTEHLEQYISSLIQSL
jgi:hypothetical protein